MGAQRFIFLISLFVTLTNVNAGLLGNLLFKGVGILGEKLLESQLSKSNGQQGQRQQQQQPMTKHANSHDTKKPPKLSHLEHYIPRGLDDFKTRTSRQHFIRKVYSIFSAQMLTTITAASIVMLDSSVANYLIKNWMWVIAASFSGSTLIVGILTSNRLIRNTVPINFILLAIHTILQSLIMASVASLLNPQSIMFGTMHTLIAFLVLTLYSFQGNDHRDLTTLGNLFMTSSACFLLGSIFDYCYKFPIGENITSALFAVLFATYLAYDTERVVDGKSFKRPFGQNDSILASLTVLQDMFGILGNIGASVKRNGLARKEAKRARGQDTVAKMLGDISSAMLAGDQRRNSFF